MKIIKQDKKTEDRLENVEFKIFDENKNVIYSNLKTNSEGEILIENLIPGKYFIQEIATKDGYVLDDDLLEFDIKYNQQLTIKINNSLKQEPKIEIENKEISKDVQEYEINEKIVKKLPVTGM